MQRSCSPFFEWCRLHLPCLCDRLATLAMVLSPLCKTVSLSSPSSLSPVPVLVLMLLFFHVSIYMHEWVPARWVEGADINFACELPALKWELMRAWKKSDKREVCEHVLAEGGECELNEDSDLQSAECSGLAPNTATASKILMLAGAQVEDGWTDTG